MHISFEQPLALILIPIGIALIIWVSRFFRTVNKNKKNRRTAMRVVIFTLVVLALAGISISMISKQASTVFLVDCSDSMKASVGAVETFVEKQIEHMPDKNQVAVVGGVPEEGDQDLGFRQPQEAFMAILSMDKKK